MEALVTVIAILFLLGVSLFIISIALILISVYIRNDILNPATIATILVGSSAMIMLSIIFVAILGLFIYIDKLI